MENLLLILKAMRHEYDKPVKLHSGVYTKVKYEIERLTDQHLKTLAHYMPRPDVERIVSKGGGMLFARVLGFHWNINYIDIEHDSIAFIRENDRILLVDDVVTTGDTLSEMAEEVSRGVNYSVHNADLCAVVIVKRGEPRLSFPLFSFFQVPSDIIEKEAVNSVNTTQPLEGEIHE